MVPMPLKPSMGPSPLGAVGRPGSGHGLDLDNGYRTALSAMMSKHSFQFFCCSSPSAAKSRVHELGELLPLSGLLPRATGLHPDVVAVPPVEQQVGVGAEAGKDRQGRRRNRRPRRRRWQRKGRREVSVWMVTSKPRASRSFLTWAAMPLICSLSVVRRVMAPG